MKRATNVLAGDGVDLERRRHLLERAVAHHGDTAAQRHRFFLIVRHVDDSGAQQPVKPAELCARLRAERRIKIGERLVQEKRIRLADDRPAQGDTLPLAA